MGVSENSVPLNPMVLLIIIPMKNGYFIGNINPTFSDKPKWWKTRFQIIETRWSSLAGLETRVSKKQLTELFRCGAGEFPKACESNSWNHILNLYMRLLAIAEITRIYNIYITQHWLGHFTSLFKSTPMCCLSRPSSRFALFRQSSLLGFAASCRCFYHLQECEKSRRKNLWILMVSHGIFWFWRKSVIFWRSAGPCSYCVSGGGRIKICLWGPCRLVLRVLQNGRVVVDLMNLVRFSYGELWWWYPLVN